MIASSLSCARRAQNGKTSYLLSMTFRENIKTFSQCFKLNAVLQFLIEQHTPTLLAIFRFVMRLIFK